MNVISPPVTLNMKYIEMMSCTYRYILTLMRGLVKYIFLKKNMCDVFGLLHDWLLQGAGYALMLMAIK